MKRSCLSCLFLMVLLCGAASGSTENAGEQVLTLSDLEYLGNPFSTRYPDGSGWEHARAVWDMHVFDDRVFLAHGSHASNAGPIDIWSYSPETNSFTSDSHVDDEMIWAFLEAEGRLYIAGTDSTEGWGFGNIYVYDGQWTKRRTIPNAIHVDSIAFHDARLFVAVSLALWDETGEQFYEGEVFSTADDGLSWRAELNREKTWMNSLFTWGGRLFGCDQQGHKLYEYAEGQFNLLPNVSLFPDMEVNEQGVGDHVDRSATIHGKLVYSGTMWPLVKFPCSALYVAADVSSGDTSRASLESAAESVADIVAVNGLCWIATNEFHADGVPVTSRFYVSSDLESWDLIARLETPTLVQSFEVLNGYLYLGLGPGHPDVSYRDTGVGAGYAIGDNNPHAGEIYRFFLGELFLAATSSQHRGRTAPGVGGTPSSSPHDPYREWTSLSASFALDCRAVYTLGSTPEGIEKVGDTLFVIDWSTGLLYGIDLEGERCYEVDTGLPFVNDLGSDGETLWIVDEAGTTKTYEIATGVLADASLPVHLQGEVLGVEYAANSLYLLVYRSIGPKLCEISENGAAQWFDIIVNRGVGELLGLQTIDSEEGPDLLTLDYANRRLYRMTLMGENMILSPYADVRDYVAPEMGDATIRGFFFSEGETYLAGAEAPGRIYVDREACASGPVGEAFTLSNSVMSIRFDPATGGVTSLVDSVTGIDLRSERRAPATILQLEVVGADGNERVLSNLNAQRVTLASLGPASVDVMLENLDGTGITAVCHVRLAADEPSLRWTLTLRNDGAYTLRSISYPVLSGMGRIGAEAADDWLVYPMGEGVLVPNPVGNLSQSQPWRDSLYPGDLSMQFMALYDMDLGLYLMTEDANGHPKRFDVCSTSIGELRALQVAVTTLVSEAAWGDYVHPYETVTRFFRGDWYVAAEEYRAWAEEQTWCSVSFREKTIPTWYRNGQPVFGTTNWFWDEVVPDTQVNPLSTLSGLVSAYSRALETPLTLKLFGWEQHGMWDNPYSMPPRDGMAAFTTMIDGLREAGQRSGVMRSITKWSSTSPGFETQGIPGAVMEAGGRVFCGGEGVNSRCLMCPADAFWRQIMQQNATETAESGVDWLELDEVPLGVYPFGCFNADHGHPVGYGVWWTDSLYSLIESSYRTCKAINPEMLITTEGPSEFFIPVTDGYVSRLSIGEADFATWLIAEIPEIQFVPVFPFVYHEYIRAYRGTFPPLESPFVRYGLVADARSLMAGEIPSWSTWDALPGRTSPTRLDSARRHAAAFTDWASAFVWDGRMLRPLSFAAPSVQVVAPDSDTLTAYRFELPAVLHSAWQALDDRVGYLFENISTSRQSLALAIPRPESDASSYLVSTVREGVQVEAAYRSLPCSLGLDLDAGEIVLITVEVGF
ncbi:hypothetical protein JW848_05160 [Candidatus Bipolaricaulota bacterium]|nr:hypothetical protein [Candidatus Bipolaricaulota bacterium]